MVYAPKSTALPFALFAFLLVFLAACTQATDSQLSLTLRPPKDCSGTFSYSVELTDSNKEGIEGQWVTLFVDGEEFERLKTDQNGRFSSIGDMHSEWCKKAAVFTATFEGSSSSKAASVEKTLTMSVCDDGTAADTCSSRTGYYCNEKTKLVFDCAKCGCATGLSCVQNECATAEARSSQLISRLQNSIVKINHTYAGGSGIVIAHEAAGGTHTFILTNSHVVKDAVKLTDLNVFSKSTRSALPAVQIYLAPKNIDLAVVEVAGEIGVPIEIKPVTSSSSQGQSVIALGSPLGFEGSVSKGIISNFVSDPTQDSNYTQKHIQTDAAVNPGNSGGGLFRESDGSLIGVNTWGISETEGLNFAIDIRELEKLGHYKEWPQWSQPEVCSDGTPEGYCSLRLRFICSESRLWYACEICGCPEGYTCYDNQECAKT